MFVSQSLSLAETASLIQPTALFLLLGGLIATIDSF